MREPGYGPFYAAGLYPKLAKIFRDHGYALAVHGSVNTDFDLIAVPWVDEAGDPDDVVKECLSKFAFDKSDALHATSKPHSRIAYTLHLSFGDCRLDISFTQRTGVYGARLNADEYHVLRVLGNGQISAARARELIDSVRRGENPVLPGLQIDKPSSQSDQSTDHTP